MGLFIEEIVDLFLWWEAGLLLLAIIPGFIVLYWAFIRAREKQLKNIGDLHLINKLFPSRLKTVRLIQFLLILLSIFFVGVALMRPQGNDRLSTVVQKGIEVVIALDTSRSMDSDDIPPSRMENAKQLCRSIIDQLIGHRVGLVHFAANAQMVCPLTTDVDLLNTFIDSIDMQPIRQGTNLKEALQKSKELFSTELAINKAVVVISDGEDLEGTDLTVADPLAEENILCFTVGIGTLDGGRIPLKDDKGNLLPNQYKKDREGNEVITKLSEDFLAQLADKLNGNYYQYDIAGTTQKALLQDLNSVQKAEYEALKVKTSKEDTYQWFLIIAILLFLGTILVEEIGKAYIRPQQA